MSDLLPIRRYASAGGVVTDASGERVLILLRPDRLASNGRPEVRLPKGHIEQGEDRNQAALREVCEEAGLPDLAILADLGHQTVEFDWKGHHYIRDESCFLMTLAPGAPLTSPEKQFERLWLAWEKAQERLTFAAEREWVRRAWAAWSKHPR